MADVLMALLAFFVIVCFVLPMVGVSLFWLTGGFRRD